MKNDWNEIKKELPLEVLWISWDTNGFGTLKEINFIEKDNELQFIIKHADKKVEDMIFGANPDHLSFNEDLGTFRTFSWSIQLLRD